MGTTSGRLKIGIACFPLIGGSGILASALGSELAARGHEVHFFSYAKPVRLDLAAPRIFFHEVAVNENQLFPCPDYTLPLAVKMAEIGRATTLDIFHAHYAVPHAIAAFLARKMIGDGAPKIVTTLHGTDTTLLGQDSDYRTAIEHALIHSDAVTTVSESLRRQTETTFRLQEAIEVVPNFFTPRPATRSREQMRRALGISDDHFLVLHMSNLRPIKRIDLLLRAFASARHHDRMRLVILAGGSFEPYESVLDELGLREQVIVTENGATIEDYLQAADAGLYTSESESFGLSILETLYFGKPVVAFRVGGVPEVVGDGARLHDFGDFAAMGASLDELIESPALRAQIGERGRERVMAQFNAAKIVPRYESIYQRVLSPVTSRA
jgi:N-acetyl-alpha-D-glucosaminyl L-malate synthase BshA